MKRERFLICQNRTPYSPSFLELKLKQIGRYSNAYSISCFWVSSGAAQLTSPLVGARGQTPRSRCPRQRGLISANSLTWQRRVYGGVPTRVRSDGDAYGGLKSIQILLFKSVSREGEA